MGNFVKTFLDGKAGKNFGMTTGIPPLDRSINGIQQGMSIGVAAAPKCGKTTLTDFAFVLHPYLQMEKMGKLDNIEWIYFSYEVARIPKEFKFAAFFMYHDYQIFDFQYKDKTYLVSGNYLMGKLIHENSDKTQELVKVTPEHEDMLKEIYLHRIVPIFGEYNKEGIKIRKGKVDLIEEADNPTGMYKYCRAYFEKHGKFIKENYMTVNDDGQIVTRRRERGYAPDNPDLFTVIITDHIRKCLKERHFNMKENIDKWLEYTTILRNRCNATPVNICHSNRGVSNVERLKFAGDKIFPTADDVKDTGNLAEESTVLLTLFNPNDEKYNLNTHFGVELEHYPAYRSIHLTESRDTVSPVHIQTNMFGGVNLFTSLNGHQ